MKVKHFSHSDLDGLGAIVLSQHVFGVENVDFEICENSNVNGKVRDFVDQYAMGELPHYDLIVITDLSLNAFEASWIDGALNNYDGETKLIHWDHHDAPWMQQERHGAHFTSMYDWYHVIKEKTYGNKTVPVCGTSLWYDYLLEEKLIQPTDLDTFAFTETIRSWDTWEWVKTGNTLAKDLNVLFHLIGKDAFISRFTNNINVSLTESEHLLLDTEKARIDRYIEKKLPQVKVCTTGSGHKAAVVYAEDCISELGHAILKQYPEADYVLLIDTGRMVFSFRTERTDLDVGEIARKIGGGGREQTAGAPFGTVLTFNLDVNAL